jgi:hypothetical protein
MAVPEWMRCDLGGEKPKDLVDRLAVLGERLPQHGRRAIRRHRRENRLVGELGQIVRQPLRDFATHPAEFRGCPREIGIGSVVERWWHAHVVEEKPQNICRGHDSGNWDGRVRDARRM